MHLKGYRTNRLECTTVIALGEKKSNEVRSVFLRCMTHPVGHPEFLRKVAVSITDAELAKAPKEVKKAMAVVEKYYGGKIVEAIEADLEALKPAKAKAPA